MAHETWARIESLFLDALEQPADGRAAWLRAVCDGDHALFAQVDAMLRADEAPADLFGGHALDVIDPAAALRLMEAPLDRVGAWRVTGHLGTGCMGTVYRGERDDGAFEQTVALKLVKRGMDTDAVLRRFRDERRILARLSHPGIARILDATRADDGRPCLVMEYVDGVPISDFCDAARLDVDARTDLVAEAGDAVAYAHRNLVVHRDLKPSNILVSEDPGSASGAGSATRVKLLDFGIAKLLADDDATVHTQTGERVYTPSYAAPEQLRGTAVTTATDVYGLGAVLYRLLTGARVVETEGRSRSEIETAVLAADPVRPSLAVTDAAAAARGTTTDRLRRTLRGDLDRIVLKALARDPEARYADARELVADLRRYRDGLPVDARAPSAGYRLRRFAERHRAAVAGVAAALLLVVGVSAFAFARVRAERDVARREAATSEAVSSFLAGLFAGTDPRATGGDDVTARQILDAGAERIATELADQPVVQARLLHVAGEAYKSLQIMDEAEPLFTRAIALRQRHLGADHLDVAASLDGLGLVYEMQGRFSEAAATHRRALAIYDAHDAPPALAQANALHGLAFAQMRLGVLDSAETAIRQTLAIKRELFGESHPEVAYSLNILGDTHTFQERYDEAIAVHRRALAMRRRHLGPNHLDVGSSLHNLGAAYRLSGDYAGAETVYRDALQMYRRYYGPDNQEVANTLGQLATAVARQGRLEEAEALARDAVATIRRTVRPDHPRVSGLLGRLADILAEQGATAEAEATYREAIALRRQDLGPDTPAVVRWLGELGVLASRRGQPADADARLREALRLCDAARNPDCATVVEDARDRLAAPTDR